jgi:hypothetical protein
MNPEEARSKKSEMMAKRWGDADIKLLTFEFWRVNSMDRALLADG